MISVRASEADFRVDEVGVGERVDEVCETESGLWIGLSTVQVSSAQLCKISISAGRLQPPCNPVNEVNDLVKDNPDNSVEALCGSGNTLWIGTRQGRVFRWDTDRPGHPEQKLDLGANETDPVRRGRQTVRALYLDGNALWIGTEEPGKTGALYRWEIDSSVTPEAPILDFGSKVNAIHGAGDTLYLGLEHGLFECDKRSPYASRPFADTPKENVIRGLYDNGQSLWIATREGLYRWDKATRERKKITLDFTEARSLFGTRSALFVGSDKGLFRIDGGTQAWTVPIERSGEYRNSISTGSQLLVTWQLGDCKRRTSPKEVEQRVIVVDQNERQVNEGNEEVDRRQDGFSFTFRGTNTPGDYRMKLQAIDLNGVASTVDLHKFSVEAPASIFDRIMLIVGLPLGVDVLAFAILLIASRRSQRAFDILTGPFTGKPFLYFRYALLYSTTVRLWVFDRYFQSVKRDFVEQHDYLKREIESLGNSAGGAPGPPRLLTDELLDQLKKTPHIHIVGGSGTGKTEMVYSLMHSYFQMDNLNNAWRRYGFIPILLRVRDCQTMAIQLLARSGMTSYGMAFDDTSFFEKLLRQGGFLIVLDGLNEGRLDDEIKTYDRPRSVRMLMTSQTELRIAGILQYRLPDFTPPFSMSLLTVLIDEDKKRKAAEIGADLLNEIRSGYDVRLIADLINAGKILPAQRIDLFRAVADNAFGANPGVSRSRVCALAWNLWKAGKHGFAPSDGITKGDLDALKEYGKIVVQRGDEYEFRHDQMRDYLAACWATQHAASVDVTLVRLNDPAIWTELGPGDQKYVFEFLTHEVELSELKRLAAFAAEDIGQRVQLFAAAKAEADKRGSPLEIQ